MGVTARGAITYPDPGTFATRASITDAIIAITNTFALLSEHNAPVIPGPITLTTAVSKIVPGATSFAIRNNADTLDNVLVTDAGVVTIRSTLITVASATGAAGLRLPHGAAPTTPVNGDVWTTTTDLLVRLNGTTRTMVSTAATQTLTAKTLTTPTINGATVSGTWTGPITFSHTSAQVFNNSSAAGVARSILRFQVAGVDRYYLGTNIANEFVLYDAAFVNANVTVSDAGLVTVRGGVVVSAGGVASTGAVTFSNNAASWRPQVVNTATANAANDAGVEFYLRNAAAASVLFGGILVGSTTITAGAETSTLTLLTRAAGVSTSALQIVGAAASFAGTLATAGALTVNTTTINETVFLTNTDNGAYGVGFNVYHNSPSPAVNDTLFDILVRGNSSTSVVRNYGRLLHRITDPTNASEDSEWLIQAMVAGTLTNIATFGATNTITGLTTFNKTAQSWTTANAGTSAVYGTFVNTGGSFHVGRDSSTGSTFGFAYGAVLWADGAFPLVVATNGTARWSFSGSSSDFLAHASAKIIQNTADGADNRSTSVGGGGDIGETRGAYAAFYGNEHAFTGQLEMAAGNIAGGIINFRTGGASRWSIDFGGDLVAASNLNIRRNTADGSDNGSIHLNGGGGAGSSRGAYVQVNGNEESGNPGALTLHAGNVAAGRIFFYTGAGVLKWEINNAGNLIGYSTMSIIMGGTPASTGAIRLSPLTGIYFRANDNLYDYKFVHLTSGNVLEIGGDQFNSTQILLDAAVLMAGATGGYNGRGTINAVAVYDDDTQLTDHVFYDNYNLMPIPEMRAFYQAHKHLPTIPGKLEWEESGKFSLGELSTCLWETVEVHARYIADEHERVNRIENTIEDHRKQIERLERELADMRSN